MVTKTIITNVMNILFFSLEKKKEMKQVFFFFFAYLVMNMMNAGLGLPLPEPNFSCIYCLGAGWN